MKDNRKNRKLLAIRRKNRLRSGQVIIIKCSNEYPETSPNLKEQIKWTCGNYNKYVLDVGEPKIVELANDIIFNMKTVWAKVKLIPT